jgi:predicted phage baseplate assembly protein
MPLPTPNLDDLRFQRDLVDEARRRIVRYCPEWTDYNLSDPGITLIELFAWMTEMLVYRLNRVPEKNHVQFMELLGIQLQPATSAQTELTFRLSAPFPLGPEDRTTTVVPQGTEVATWVTAEGEPQVVFTTDEKLSLSALRLTQLRREDDLNRNYLPRLGIEDFYTFSRQRPQVGDTFYIGFDGSQEMSGYVLRLAFEARDTEAPGINREDPPLVWECSTGNGRWQEIVPSKQPRERDTTGGLNNAQGSIVFYLPLAFRPDLVHGRSAYWIRCRYEPRRTEQGTYGVQSPRLRGLAAHTLGGAISATHAQIVLGEVLGRSSGDPGQIYRLQYVPVLALRAGETVEVQEERDGETVYVPWERVPDFSRSSRYDRHFTLDEATGEVCFGPCVIQPDGTMYQYGRVPEAGRSIRVSRYRHGGGVLGNVPADKLQVLRSAIPYVDRVTNLQRATGGRDQETLEEAKLRAQRIVRAQQRAVTAEDFESLARQSSRAVARVKCIGAGEVEGDGQTSTLPPGMVELLVVPAAFEAIELGDLSALSVGQSLRSTVSSYLNQYRLLTTTVSIREPRYLGIVVRAQIVPSEAHAPARVVDRVTALLRLYLSPLALESEDERLTEIIGPEWEGWPFGRDLYVSELFSLIQQVPGVKHVLDVQLGQRPIVPARMRRMPGEEEGGADREEEQMVVSGERIIAVPEDALLCLVSGDVEVVSL